MSTRSRRPRDAASAPALLETGRAAYERRAWRDAWDALSRADAIEPLRGADLDRLARAAGLAGRHEDYCATLERLHDAHLGADDVPAAVRAAVWLGLHLLHLGEMGRGSAWVSRAEGLIEQHPADCVERGYLLLPKAFATLFRKRDAAASRDLAAQATQTAERFGDDDLASLSRSVLGQALIALGEHDAGLGVLDQAMLTASSRPLSPMVTGIVYCTLISCCQRVYAIDRSREWTAALEAWCEGQPQLGVFTGDCRVHRSEIMQLRGEWPEAIEEARRASERFQDGPDPAKALAFYQQGEILRLRGELQAAESAYRQASERGRVPQPGLALLRLEQGETESAAAAIRQVLDSTTDPFVRARFLPAGVEILIAAGDLEGASQAAAELERLSRGKANPVLDAMAAHASGALRLAQGDARAAVEPLRRAFDAWQSIGAPYLAARIRAMIGSALETLGDRDGAQLEREAAAKAFQDLGAVPDLTRLEARKGAKREGQPFGLTARELEVLRLVASGQTNRAIAEQLFLSEKTVDRHVSNLFTKLDVHTRAAATAFAYRHRLV